MGEAFDHAASHVLLLGERLAAATTREAVLDAALLPTMLAVGAVGGAALLCDAAGETVTVAASSGLTDRPWWRDGPVTSGTPVGDAVARRQPLYAEGDALDAAFPHTDGPGSARSTAVVPLLLPDRVPGVLVLEFMASHRFTPDERTLLRSVAAQVALGLDRADALARPAPDVAGERATDPGSERAFLDTVLNNLGEGIVVCDAQGTLVRFAGLATDMHGQDAEPLPPEQWAAHYHLYTPDLSRPLTVQEIPLYRAWRGETVRDVEIAICRPGAAPQHLLVNGQPLVTPDGQRVGAVVAQRDVTPLARQTTVLRERTAQLVSEQAAAAAFVTFSEAASHLQTVQELGDLAMATLQVMLPGVTSLFYEPQGGAWCPVAWTPGIAPDLLAELQRGLPFDTPILAQMTAAREPVFLDEWTEAEQGVAHTGSYRAVAAYPVMQGGTVAALLTLGVTTDTPWTDTQRRLITAVGRSFTLLYERVSAARAFQEQRDEAEKRTRALEAFAEMSRELAAETDRYVLVRRAQEIMLSLLTPGYALYWEQAPDRWELKSQVGEIGNPALQTLVDEHGLPLDAPALHSTWVTGRPNYQDNYAQGADTPADMIRHVHAATAFRVTVRGQPLGMLAIGLFDQRTWTPMDRAVLETAIYSLSLVLERAQGFAALEHANRELQIANGELQAFAYSVSHDLRTPVRHVKGFTEIALRALATGNETAVRRHLSVVLTAADRMTEMIDAMLSLSRAGRSELRFSAVPLGDLAQQAYRDARAEFPERAVTWRVEDLPTVLADAGTLQQVFTNLVSNAVKFAAPARPLHVRVWAEERAQEWVVHVQDTGVGFDPRYADRLFGVFQRLHTHDQFPGTGVGLATVKRIVARHGGRVWAHGEVDVGATFAFTVPKLAG